MKTTALESKVNDFGHRWSRWLMKITGKLPAAMVVLLVLAGAASGCALSAMHPGENCAKCHTGNSAPRFGAAGTVYLSARESEGIANVTLDITDSLGRSTSVVSNGVGNFFTTQLLQPPLQVRLSRAGAAGVSSTAPSGECNLCHTGGSSLARIYVR